MTRTLARIVFTMVAVFLFNTATAQELLRIHADSQQAFAGSYLADQHIIAFESSVQNSESVAFKVHIDGISRAAEFNLRKSELSLDAGETKLSETERKMMYDAALAIADYIQDRETSLGDHLLVLVGAMEDWSYKTEIQ